MKLLATIGALSAGGAERVLSILSKSFADEFEEVHYVIWHNMPVFYELDPRVQLHVLDNSPDISRRYRDIFPFRRLVKQIKPDIVLSFLTPYNMLTCVACIGLKVKLVVAERNDPMYLKGGNIMRFARNLLYRRADGLLAQTKYSKSCYSGRLNRICTIIPNPVIMNSEYVGRALDSDKKNKIVSVGRLDPQKDQATLITAFSLFLKKHPDWTLEIYGEGPLRQELEAQVHKLSLEGKVLLPGTSYHIWDCMKSARIFVLSSITEGMSNALIEAMCLGLPVISTDVAGSGDLIKSGDNGFIVRIGDYEAIADKMSILANNAQLISDMGEQASTIHERLNINIISQQWVQYLCGL